MDNSATSAQYNLNVPSRVCAGAATFSGMSGRIQLKRSVVSPDNNPVVPAPCSQQGCGRAENGPVVCSGANNRSPGYQADAGNRQ